MAALNPMMIISLLKNGDPRQAAMQIIQNNFPNNPQMTQLIQMAENGDITNLQRIAEQALGAQGKNFTTEMNNLLQAVKSF